MIGKIVDGEIGLLIVDIIKAGRRSWGCQHGTGNRGTGSAGAVFNLSPSFQG